MRQNVIWRDQSNIEAVLRKPCVFEIVFALLYSCAALPRFCDKSIDY
jgi:hypothetical protein